MKHNNSKIAQFFRKVENKIRQQLWRLRWRQNTYKRIITERDVMLLRPDLLHSEAEVWERLDVLQRRLGHQAIIRIEMRERLEIARVARLRLLETVKKREFAHRAACASALFGYE